ncbi:MAG: RluA family pseudouridine synthase [candidate division Zixibacteria bacterium]|nr:RluA family pseudouridine synthase [candidate division Zixibacteria bacterium]
MDQTIQLKPTLEDKGKRLDLFLAGKNLNLSRSRIQKLIDEGKITVQDKKVKSHYKIKGDEKIVIEIPPPEKLSLEPQDIPLDIVYEDKDLLAVNKPAGMVVHPAAGNYKDTLVNALLFHCKDLSGINGVLRPGIVHRLDKNTSGLLVVAKNDFAHTNLADQLKNRTLTREYAAFCWGNLPKEKGVVETLIGRSGGDRKMMTVVKQKGREAITEYEVLERFPLGDYLRIKLKTGRTHQIRVHFLYLNHPVMGDPEYGGRKKHLGMIKGDLKGLANQVLKLIDRQALHAKKIGFVHPRTKKYMEFESELPGDMKGLLEFLRKR